MKKFLVLGLFVMAGIICSASFGQDCANCGPVRNAVATVVQVRPVQVASNVVSGGVQLVQNAVQNTVSSTRTVLQNARCRTQQTLRMTRNRLRCR